MRTAYFKILTILLISLLMPLLASGNQNTPKDFVLVLDAGHGGKDVGAAENSAREKDINLGVALQLENLINKKMKNVRVVMTRDDDTYLTLQQRADIANKAKGNLFISIHTNSVDKSNRNRKTVSGASVYALGLHKDDNNMKVAMRENSVIELENNFEQKYSGFDPMKDESYIIFEMAQKKNLSQSIRFAEDAHRQLTRSGRKARGVHQAGFWVLWATSMPAVLVELDFICNPESASYLNSKKGQKELAEAIFDAVHNYVDAWEKNTSGASASSVAYTEPIEDNGTVAVLQSKPLTAKKETSSVVQANRQPVAKRRRRSETARQTSMARNIETESITVHTDNERAPKMVSQVSEPPADPVVDEPKKEDGKKKKKKDKKKKEDEKQKKLQDSKPSHNAKSVKFVNVYKIQILASKDLLRQNDPRFRGLSPITTYHENDMYKYYYGESTEKAEIDKMLGDVRKLIPDAFVVSSLKSRSAVKQ